MILLAPQFFLDKRHIYSGYLIYTEAVKRLIEIDDDALDQAQRHLGTSTMKATVNEALRLAAGRAPNTGQDIDAALDVLAGADLVDRDAAWR